MYYKLESLRGLAALLVVLYHSPYHFNESPSLFIHNSYLFVDLFFVLSGFVMSCAYGDKIKAGTGIHFNKYILLRMGRIYPLHLVTLLLVLTYATTKSLLFYFDAPGGAELLSMEQIPTFIGNLFLLQSVGVFDGLTWNTPSWSISAEAIAYVFFFWCSLTLDKNRSLWLPPLLSFVCYLFLFTLGRNNLDITFDYGFIRCIAAFYLGVGVFRLRRLEQLNQMMEKRIEALEWLTVGGVISSVIMAEIAPWMWALAIVNFAFAIMVFSSNKHGSIGRVLLTKPLILSGRWSYSVYMLHFIIILLFTNLFGMILLSDTIVMGWFALGVNTVILLITLAASALSFEWVEKRWRDKTKAFVKNRA